MDPDENLKDQLMLAKKLIDDPERHVSALMLAELVIAMDDWLSKGGFLPAAWRKQ